jgi:hypothetical protein
MTLGKTPSASLADVYAVSREVHATLAASAEFSDIRWSWDGMPGEDNLTREPTDTDAENGHGHLHLRNGPLLKSIYRGSAS